MTSPMPAAALAFGLFLTPLAAQAATAIAVLKVHHARCELCPLIVEGALKQVKGVETVKVSTPDSAGDMTADVVFDSDAATPAALGKVVADHGYPTEVAEQMSTQDILKLKPMK